MGLDLVVQSCAKPGEEAEWRRFIERSFASDDEASDSDVARFREISIPPYERIGAPRVNHDPAANDWILKARGAKTPEEAATILKEFDGYDVVRLVACDGVPQFSSGDLYEGVDGTSLRGQVLEDCSDVLGKNLIDNAWNHKMPGAAVAYGNALVAAADEAARAVSNPARPRALLARLGLTKERTPTPLQEQVDIVRGAGRWFIFWGERGHPIRAWF